MTQETQQASWTPEHMQRTKQLEGIFMPYARKKRAKLYKDAKSRARFVHYTSAEAALSIIQQKRMWMRSTTCMSDYSEVQLGYSILKSILSDEATHKEL